MSLVEWIGIASVQISDEVETCLIYSHGRQRGESSFTHQVSRQKYVSPSMHLSIVIQNDGAGAGTRSRAGITFHKDLIHGIWYDSLWRSREGRDITSSPSDSRSCHSPLTLLQIRRIVHHQPNSNPPTSQTLALSHKRWGSDPRRQIQRPSPQTPQQHYEVYQHDRHVHPSSPSNPSRNV